MQTPSWILTFTWTIPHTCYSRLLIFYWASNDHSRQLAWNPERPWQVNAAYKKALLRYHPDRTSASVQGDPQRQVEAEETFKLITRMKQLLKPSSMIAMAARWHWGLQIAAKQTALIEATIHLTKFIQITQLVWSFCFEGWGYTIFALRWEKSDILRPPIHGLTQVADLSTSPLGRRSLPNLLR